MGALARHADVLGIVVKKGGNGLKGLREKSEEQAYSADTEVPIRYQRRRDETRRLSRIE